MYGGFCEAVCQYGIDGVTKGSKGWIVVAGKVQLRLVGRQTIGGQFRFHEGEQSGLVGCFPGNLQPCGRGRGHRSREFDDAIDGNGDIRADIEAANVDV